MDVRYCNRCKRLFQRTSNTVYCPACLIYFEECFDRVKKFIWDNPSADFNKVVKGAEVEDKVLLEFIRSGRIEFTNPDLGIPCEVCGSRIASGRYCAKCAGEVKDKLEKTKKDLMSSMKKDSGESEKPRTSKKGDFFTKNLSDK